MNIWSKLVLLLTLTSVCPLMILSNKSLKDFDAVLQIRVEKQNLALAKLVAKETYSTLTMARQMLLSLCQLEDFKSLNPENLGKTLDSFSKEFSLFKNLYVIKPKQTMVYATRPDLFNLDSGWGWTRVQGNKYRGNLSDISFNRGGKPTIRLEDFIGDKNNNPIAVLGGELDLGYISENLKRLDLSKNTQAYAVTRDGEIIATTGDPNQKLEPWPFRFFMQPNRSEHWLRGGKKFISTVAHLRQFDPYRAPDWYIIIEQPWEEAFYESLALNNSIFNTTWFALAVAVIFGFIYGQSLTRPILTLVRHANKIASGNLSETIQITSDDEFGDLAHTFEYMRASLEKKENDLARKLSELNTLNELGKAICSTLQIGQLTELILRSTTQLFHAERGSLMLLNDDENQLIIHASQGVWEKSIEKFTGTLGDPIAGWVYQRKTPLFIQNTQEDPLLKNFRNLREIGGGSMMSVPLEAKDKVLGVLNLRHSDSGFFSLENFEMFRQLAQAAAIGIENARLYQYAVTDEMTKLYNHRYFQMRLEEEMQRADRFDTSVSLLVTDVDHFKNFNDTYGHQEGDRVLKIVAAILQREVRDIDVVCRYGGEEFCVICPNKNSHDARLPAERIRTAIESENFLINGKRVMINISIGIACYPSNAATKEELIRKADTALYASKHGGRNRSTVWDESMSINSEK